MPNSTNYGPTGRPPGEFHIRHSFKEISDILEFPFTPFDIFFTEFANNNNNNFICCYKDGGIQRTINNTSTYDDNNEADTAHSIHRTDEPQWFESIFSNNNNNTDRN